MSKARQSKTAKKARRVEKAVRRVQKKFAKTPPPPLTKKVAKKLHEKLGLNVEIKRNKVVVPVRDRASALSETAPPAPMNVYEWGIRTGRRPPVMFRVKSSGAKYCLDAKLPVQEVLGGRVQFIPLRVGKETLCFGHGGVEECQ